MIPALITDEELDEYERLCAAGRSPEQRAMELDFTERRRYWRQVGEYLGTRIPPATVTAGASVNYHQPSTERKSETP